MYRPFSKFYTWKLWIHELEHVEEVNQAAVLDGRVRLRKDRDHCDALSIFVLAAVNQVYLNHEFSTTIFQELFNFFYKVCFGRTRGCTSIGE